MKKFINTPKDFVTELLQGIEAAHASQLLARTDARIVFRKDSPIPGKVGLVAGGGSGHEPLHAGYVGYGMLDAACVGEVFTGPSDQQISQAIRQVDSGAGVLLIAGNYVGDVINFESALLQGRQAGKRILHVIIDDDVAASDSLYSEGRRGLGTTVIAEKICGAAAEMGYPLSDLAELCYRINASGRSIGTALAPCVLPGVGKPSFEIGAGEMEFGVGMHGEPGRERLPFTHADEVTELMVSTLLGDGTYVRTTREWDERHDGWRERELVSRSLRSGDSVLALVSGMGGTPLSELYVIYRKLQQVCERNGITIARCLVGSYITALETQGCSMTLLRVDDEMIGLWDHPVRTPGLRWGA